MIFSVEINNQIYKFDGASGINIAIPLEFGGAQPNAYGVERAAATPCEAGEIIGDTRRGGSCNFEQIKFIPHCNGTHTESVGHITDERISIHACLQDAFITAALISIEPVNAACTNETYAVELNADDKLITKNALEKALENPKSEIRNPKSEALIVRTLPNSDGKKSQIYLENIPPFFSTEAMNFICERGFKHLLVDVPSIDRIFDEGNLSNHRIFWNVAAGSFETNENSRIHNTVTELIYAPENVADGFYLLNLQIAPFVADASPSRPILFEVLA